ncbi:hypothetical protein [Lewinella sp. LCG006]|uniref:hypothetical protein n=1 Tax=Lewinella sp. LCG006 TaxID=3231911 RepID=UPI00346116F8
MRKFFSLLTFTVLLAWGCNPCEFDCQNGGDCNDGTCECPEEYEGADCSIHKDPLGIKFLTIEASNIPALNPDNESWDADGSGPDIVVAYRRNTYYGDLTPVTTDFNGSSMAHTGYVSLVNRGDNPLYEYYIGVFDKEEGSGVDSFELIGEYRFDISELARSSNYGTELHFEAPGLPTIDLVVEYWYED